jgi:hypothetical protein
VEFRGDVYYGWSHDENLRTKVRAANKAGSTLRSYGEMSQYKERWQFVIRDASWVK